MTAAGNPSSTGPVRFAQRLVAWYRRYGRHDLPWQAIHDPYRVWVSEVMLQQTQVATVIPYYGRFLERFPNIARLAGAPLDEVMRLWSGLGYYSRARNLHRAAQRVVEDHDGKFPRRFEDVLALPGVGRSTAAAICAFAFGARHAILDGNVRRVLCRAFGIEGFPGSTSVQRRLWALAEQLLPSATIGEYTQALMDLGATVCVRGRPDCGRCPLQPDCVARHTERVEKLPEPRPRRARPVRRTGLLILLHGGQVLLEKRAPAGIWGGLWSLPEVQPDAEVAPVLRERFGARVRTVRALPVVSHGFTHFQLEIVPLHVTVSSLDPAVRSPGYRWLPLDEAVGAALPAPVRVLLSALGHGKGTGRMRASRKRTAHS